MDIVVDGKTINVNLNLPDFKKLNQPKSQGTDFAAMLEEQNKVKSEILEKGFGTYVSDMQKEKLEKEIREKILSALGLTEDGLASLPAKQRAAIEKTIQETIAEQMKARMEDKAQESKKQGNITVPLVAGLSM
jgi:pyrroline-5-carboxylate reductase